MNLFKITAYRQDYSESQCQGDYKLSEYVYYAIARNGGDVAEYEQPFNHIKSVELVASDGSENAPNLIDTRPEAVEQHRAEMKARIARAGGTPCEC
ncbi:hypothetical protein [Desulfocurvibacter africanus]|uniref:hypothetical protein n=1 Tax=Desulfocurvibacter africanus TaxID=873 RepID=UPI00040EC601|nr:hypothetical protein [Desulfocurvibacter africanus]